jgi:arylsulfatase A-like enzyme
LAEQGVLFRRAFCLNPTCSPSRASLLTGQSPHVNGMVGLAHRGFALNDYSHHLVQVLKKHGYTTALSSSGAQHVAAKADQDCIGYDEILDTDFPSSKDPVARADDFLSRADRPFFLSVGFGDTHRQFQAPSADEPRTDPRYASVPATLPDTPETRADFAAFVTEAKGQDAKMGAILDLLDKHDLAENTLVVCTTDHGIAFPGMKCNLTHHGTGVYLILRGPGDLTGGKVVDAMVTHLDIFPTICDLLQIEQPDWLEGASLLPVITGQAEALHEETFAEVNYHAAYEPMRSVRTDRYVYIRRFEPRTSPVLPNCDDSPSKQYWLEGGWRDRRPDAEQLYDCVFDPNEVCNVAEDPRYSDVLGRMRSRLDHWMRETHDPLLSGRVPAPAGARITVADAESNAGPTETL